MTVTVHTPRPDLKGADTDLSGGASTLTIRQLLRGQGGGRYAVATLVSSIGGGLIRPFLLLYAVTISGLALNTAGLALSAGFVLGLAAVPLAGRWVDTGARRALMVSTLTLRALGLVALLIVPGPAGFVVCCLLQGLGNQSGPIAQSAVVASLTSGYERDAVLAALRSLANGGLGIGALAATVAVSFGDMGVHWLAAGTAAGYAISAALVATVPLIATVPLTATVPSATTGSARVSRTGSTRSRLAPVSRADRPILRRLAIMNAANLPFAFCFDILEVALPILLIRHLHAAPAWSSGIFVTNTAVVVLAQLPVVMWLSRRPRRHAFGLAGVVLAASYVGFLSAGAVHGNLGAALVAVVSVVYDVGEIMYTGVSTALVVNAAPPHLRGRAIARWQLSLGLGRAIAPLAITAALSISASSLWLPLAALTVLGARVIISHAPTDTERRGPAPTDSRASSRGRQSRRDRRRERTLRHADSAHELRRTGYQPGNRYPALHRWPR